FEAGGEWCPRRIDEHADALEAQALQSRSAVGTEPQGSDGKRREGFFLFSSREAERQVRRSMGKRPRRTWRAGNGAASRQIEFFEAPDEILEQGLFAAEEMSAAGDIKEEAIA